MWQGVYLGWFSCSWPVAGSDTIPAETLDPQKERKVERRPGVYGAKQNKETATTVGLEGELKRLTCLFL